MPWKKKFDSIIDGFKNGDIYSLARMITLVEDHPDYSWEIIKHLPEAKPSQIIGITGSPGAGKSTMVSSVVKSMVQEGKKVGIIAVDPSSPFTMGAFLGDRIRMRELSKFNNVYIRSVASRGSVGGLCDAIYDIVDVMMSFGFDKILIETVGAGQSEIEVVFVADTVLLVMSPDGGDEIQMFKAGIMEIADAYIVNKMDLPEANSFYVQLKNTLMLENDIKSVREVFPVCAAQAQGISEVVNWVSAHYNNLIDSGEITNRHIKRKKRRVRSNILRIFDGIIYSEEINEKELQKYKEAVLRKFYEEEFGNEN